MSKKIDQEYIKELARSLCFEFSDEQLQKIIQEIQELDQELQKTDFAEIKSQYSPVNYTRVVNCASFRKDDKADKRYKKDYLSNAKKAGKYVVGR